jgi:nucleotide-binding universal stress UspA family protein
MNNIIIATDFSEHAKSAAGYGYALAGQLKCNVVLFNAMITPAVIPQAGMVAWPIEEYDLLIDDGKNELSRWKEQLKQINIRSDFKPVVKCVSETGQVTDVLKAITAQHETELVVTGTHGNWGVGEFLLGNHTKNMIDEATKPLLLISPGTLFKPVKKIAFATDFNNIKADLKTIYELIPMARMLNAELLITHVAAQKDDLISLEKSLQHILVDISNKADYPHIYYRLIENDHIKDGLEWLCEQGQIDMLAMVHRHNGFYDKLFNRSLTQKVARNIHIPLLVLPVSASLVN